MRQRDAQQPVGLVVVAHALGASQHGGVIGHHHGAAALGPKQRAVDAANAGDHAVGGRVGDQILFAAAAALRGHGQRAMLHERAFVTQVGNVFARSAPAQRVAFGDGLYALRIEREGVAVDHALQVGAGRAGRRLQCSQRGFLRLHRCHFGLQPSWNILN